MKRSNIEGREWAMVSREWSIVNSVNREWLNCYIVELLNLSES